MGSLAARLGYTWGRTLFYAKGGWAFGDVTVGAHNNTGDAPFVLIGPYTILPAGGLLASGAAKVVTGTSTTLWNNGWTVGGGMEFALTDRWSAKAEYMHYDLGSSTYTTDVNGLKVDANTSGDIVRVGVNYHLYP